MRPIILDTDPGIDDAVALVVLHHYAADAVKLIVSGYGNVKREHTVDNALTMCSLLNWKVPVLPASETTCSGEYEPAPHIHGINGFAGLTVPHDGYEPLASDDWLETLYRTIIEEDSVDYITLGALTNLALLLRRYPDVKAHIGRIVTMGGGIGKGNTRPFAEFNIFCDPESADFLMKTADNLTLVPLNTTETVAFNKEQIAEIGRYGTPLSRILEKILNACYESCTRYGELGATMHDSTAVLAYLFPELFSTERCGITVNTKEFPGRTTVDLTRNNITLTKETNAALLLEKITACIAP